MTEAARQVVKQFEKATTESEERARKLVKKITLDAREYTRAALKDMAEDLRRKYGLTVPEARQFLHEMLEVSL